MDQSPGNLENKTLEISAQCFQSLLDFQMPWGEWGESGNNHEERLRRVGRDRALVQLEKFAKPNIFRTLLAAETITWLTGEQYRHRIDRALKWIDRQERDGWFLTWMEKPTGPTSEYPREVLKVPDVRHTAQAVLMNIKFRGLTYGAVSAIGNLLDYQSKGGGWPDDLISDDTGLLSTVYSTELLYILCRETTQKQMADLGRRDLSLRVRPALDRARSWLFEQNREQNGLWKNSYNTAIVLDRVGINLFSDYPDLVISAVNRLYDTRDGAGWINEGVGDPRMREVSRTPTTLRVASCLSTLSHHGVSIKASALSGAKEYLIDHFSLNRMDAPDVAYMLRIFCQEPQQSEKIKTSEYYDYLSADGPLPLPQRERIEGLLKVWLEWSAARLEKLEPGMKLGISDYLSAYTEEKSKLCLLLETTARISGSKEIQELALVISQSPDSETFQVNLQQMMSSVEPKGVLHQMTHFLKTTAHSIYTEFLPKVIAEILKQ